MLRKGIMFAIAAAAFAAAAPLAATGAMAAFLMDIQGAVLVNDQPVSVGLEVAQGDRVKVVEGSAKLVYANGASVRIPPGQTMVVLSTPPEQASLKDEGWQAPENHEREWVVAGSLGLALALSLTPKPKPASP